MPRALLLAIAPVVLLVPGTVAAQGYNLSAYSTCASTDSSDVIWTASEPPGPNPYPDWVGYDVLRRFPTDCGDWPSFVRVNDEIIPRQVGTTHTFYFGEVVPSTATLYEYWVQPVDVNHQSSYPCCGFCSPYNVFQLCPPLSAPATIGTLRDDLFLWMDQCPGSCYPGAYVVEGPIADGLRQYAGTGTTFRFFGSMACGTVEGCALSIDHWEFTTCVTPVAIRSWGRLKTIYRQARIALPEACGSTDRHPGVRAGRHARQGALLAEPDSPIGERSPSRAPNGPIAPDGASRSRPAALPNVRASACVGPRPVNPPRATGPAAR